MSAPLMEWLVFIHTGYRFQHYMYSMLGNVLFYGERVPCSGLEKTITSVINFYYICFIDLVKEQLIEFLLSYATNLDIVSEFSETSCSLSSILWFIVIFHIDLIISFLYCVTICYKLE